MVNEQRDGDPGPDGYTGEVSPGGAPDVRRMGCLTLTKVAVDPDMSNNCYLLHCSEGDEVVLVDAAAEPERLLELVGGRRLSAVVTTHQHWDHHRGLAAVVAAHPGATVVAGEPDADAIEQQTGVTVHRRVADGDTVTVGTCELGVVRLTGHTPGSIALLLDDTSVSAHPHLFTGDSLFPGGPGRTTSPEDFTSLMDDLEAKVFDRLPDATWFYPGHGNDSTLGAERASLAEWRARGW